MRMAWICALLLASTAYAERPRDANGDGVTSEGLVSWYESLVVSGKPLAKPRLEMGTAMQTGEVGEIPYATDQIAPHVRTSVLQVISADSLLLQVDRYIVRQRVVGQTVLNPEERLLETAVVMVKGIPTAGLADDARVRLPGGWIVAGTEAYQTADGTKRTAYVLKPHELTNRDTEAAVAKAQKWRADKEARDMEAAQKEKERAEFAAKQKFRRIWKTRDGAHSVDAYFFSQSGDNIRLERADNGKRVDIAPARLCDEDLAFVRAIKRTGEPPE